jgi:hypothetical protein
MNISRALLEDFKRFAIQNYRDEIKQKLKETDRDADWVIEIIDSIPLLTK